MNRTDILHKLGELLDQHKFEPKNDDTLHKMIPAAEKVIEEAKEDDWVIHVNMYHVDEHAMFFQVFIKKVGARATPPEILWVEDPVESNIESDYSRAMSIIE